MPKVTVEHKCAIASQDVVSKITKFFETDKDLSKLDPNITCKFASGSKKGVVTGSKFKADIVIKDDGSGSLVEVIVDLPLIFTPFKGKVQETIEKKLRKVLV
jgi:hypothetical protein